jgi:hypothetical protein
MASVVAQNTAVISFVRLVPKRLNTFRSRPFVCGERESENFYELRDGFAFKLEKQG